MFCLGLDIFLIGPVQWKSYLKKADYHGQVGWVNTANGKAAARFDYVSNPDSRKCKQKLRLFFELEPGDFLSNLKCDRESFASFANQRATRRS